MPGERRDGGRWTVSWSTTAKDPGPEAREADPRERPGDRITGQAGKATDLDTTVANGRRVLVTCGDTTVRLWDPAAGGLVGDPLAAHRGRVAAVATIMIGGRPHAVSGGDDGVARLWDLTTGRQVGPVLSRHPARDPAATPLHERIRAAFAGVSHHQVFTVAAANAGGVPVAVVGGEDGAQVWDLATGAARGEPLIPDLVTGVVTAEVEGRAVAVTNGGPSRIQLWDLATGAAVGELPGDIAVDGVVTALAAGEFVGAGGGRTVVFTARSRRSGDSSIQMWDPVTCLPVGEPMTDRESRTVMGPMAVTVLDGRSCVVSAVHVPRGRAALVAWDLASGEQVGESEVFPSIVAAVIPYPDGPQGSLAVAWGLDVAVLTPR